MTDGINQPNDLSTVSGLTIEMDFLIGLILFNRENISLHGWARDQGIAVSYKQMSRIVIFGIEFEF